MPSKWAYLVLGIFLTLFWSIVLTGGFHWLGLKKPIKYDCSMASFHPDIPETVKAKCLKEKT